MSPSEEFFGDERVTELVAHSDRDGEALLQHLVAQVLVFEGGTQPFDDKGCYSDETRNRLEMALNPIWGPVDGYS